MNAWAIRIPLADAPAAGALRLSAGIEALLCDDALWLRGNHCDDPLILQLRKLAGEFFSREADHSLTPLDRVLPVAALPPGSWRPIGEVLQPIVPTAALPGRLTDKIALSVCRTWEEKPATLLRVSRERLAAFVDTAPAIRLRPLRFALGRNAVLIAGSPLPPIAGERFAESNGIAVPCGYALRPIDDATVIASLLSLNAGDIAIFDLAARAEIVRAESFISLTRAALRLSLAGGAP